MSARPQPAVPLADALRDSDALTRLVERVRESRRRFECIEALLPPPLAAQTRPGPLDEHGWTLLAHTPAAAAKLRQLVPLIEVRLAEERGVRTQVRIKVQP
ncbi:MAG: hypothetical protein LKCHEGNO_00047 [Burkholderiaceae bacterium]|nr:hypothetical protein [Burkholderiaceae bacterium]